MRLISTTRSARRTRLRTSANKETDVTTPVLITRMLAMAAVAAHIAHIAVI
jgi:hypothetical protein